VDDIKGMEVENSSGYLLGQLMGSRLLDPEVSVVQIVIEVSAHAEFDHDVVVGG
jgi:hypothetical protein